MNLAAGWGHGVRFSEQVSASVAGVDIESGSLAVTKVKPRRLVVYIEQIRDPYVAPWKLGIRIHTTMLDGTS